MFINGEWRGAKSGRTFDVTNPATGEVIQAVPDGGAEDALEAIAAADAAFAGWAGRTAFGPFVHPSKEPPLVYPS